jgi:succinate dehydrogenase / fumarate reductase cytochrome b subunit
MSTAVSGNLSASASNPMSTYITKASVGKKVLMAVTGVMAFGFVVGHMVGNLQVFIGQDQINDYAVKLQSLGALLWVIRAVLLTVFVIHIWMGIKLKLENWAARPVGYQNARSVQTSLASKTMIWTGLTILAFVIYHLLHFTVQAINPEYKDLHDAMGRHDVYSMIIMGFSYWGVSAFYLVAVGLLSYHLSHGVASMFQSLGLNNPKWQKRLDGIAWFFTIFLFVGYASIPISVLAGLLTLPEGVM